METKFKFNGTGGELFAKLFVGALLTGITVGIYLPWFIVDLNRYVYAKTTLRTPSGDVRLEFTGTGGELFKIGLLGALLSSLTIGIYVPWFVVNLTRFYSGHSKARTESGLVYSLEFGLTGGEAFKELLVGALLTGLTMGIYGPWLVCRINKVFASKTAILLEGRKVGGFDFVGKGGDFFVHFLVGALLTMVTVGIYQPWFQVKTWQLMARNTTTTLHGEQYSGDFVGTGGDYFVLLLVGGLLTVLTAGIYGFWFIANQLRFQLDGSVYRVGARRSEPAPAAMLATA